MCTTDRQRRRRRKAHCNTKYNTCELLLIADQLFFEHIALKNKANAVHIIVSRLYTPCRKKSSLCIHSQLCQLITNFDVFWRCVSCWKRLGSAVRSIFSILSKNGRQFLSGHGRLNPFMPTVPKRTPTLTVNDKIAWALMG